MSHCLSLPADSGQSSWTEACNHVVKLNSSSAANECEEAPLKEQKQSEQPALDENAHVIDENSWETLSDEEGEPGSSSVDVSLDTDSEKSLDTQGQRRAQDFERRKSQT